MSESLDLLSTARLVGHYRHAELASFAALGARALGAEGGRERHYLLRASASHGYRAGLLEAVLPVSDALPRPESLTVAIDTRIDSALFALCALGDAELVAGLCDVYYPMLLASYAAHLERCSAYADPPLALVLRRCVAELEAVQSEGQSISAPSAHGALADLEDLLSGGVRLGERR